MYELPFNIDLLKLSAKQIDGEVWLRLTDALEEAGASKGNVTFWANSISTDLPGSVKMLLHANHRTEINCHFVNIAGLFYLALRAKSRIGKEIRSWAIANMHRKDIIVPHGIPLGVPLAHEGKSWYLFARLVNQVVHYERGAPRQTVTTVVKSIPKDWAKQLPQQDANGRSLSMAWHVTPEGVLYYLLAMNVKRANLYKAQLAVSLANYYKVKFAELGKVA